MRALVLGTAMVLVALAACGSAPREQPRPPAPQVDTKVLRDLSDARVAALGSGDIDGYLALHADDVVWMPPNSPDIIGKENGRRRLQQVFADMTVEQKIDTEELIVMSPEWVGQRGQYSVVVSPKLAGEGRLDVGSFLTVWHLDKDGKWRVALDIWKSNRPAPEPEGKK